MNANLDIRNNGDILWCGRKIEELTREQLLQAVRHLAASAREADWEIEEMHIAAHSARLS